MKSNQDRDGSAIHNIETIKQLADVITTETLDEMIGNLTEWATLVATAKALKMPVEFHSIKWVEDGKSGISEVNIKIVDKEPK